MTCLTPSRVRSAPACANTRGVDDPGKGTDVPKLTVEAKPWPRDARYTVHSDGRIVGPSGRTLRPIIQHDRPGHSNRPGITWWTPTQGWKRVQISVMVCETFHGPRPAGYHAAHENGDTLDNRAENLAWKTATENEADKRRHGRSLQGERHHQAKLTEDDVRAIRAARAGYGTGRALALQYGVTEATISSIIRGQTWKHI